MNSLKRYKKWLIIWIVFIVFFCIILIVNAGLIGQFSIYKILTHNLAIDTAILFLLIPVACIIGFFIGGYLFTPLFIFVHKKILGRNLIYGIKEIHKPKEFKGAFLSVLFPALLAFNFGILLSDEPILHEFLFSDTFMDAGGAILQILTLVFLFPIVSGIAVCVFSATYFLLDSGIEYTNKNQKKVIRGSFPTEVRSMGGFYLYYLKGYAGISVVISLVKLLVSFFTTIGNVGGAIFFINAITWPLIPFAITFFMIPVNIIQDWTYESRKAFTLKWAGKFEIRGQLEDPLGTNQ